MSPTTMTLSSVTGLKKPHSCCLYFKLLHSPPVKGKGTKKALSGKVPEYLGRYLETLCIL